MLFTKTKIVLLLFIYQISFFAEQLYLALALRVCLLFCFWHRFWHLQFKVQYMYAVSVLTVDSKSLSSPCFVKVLKVS